MVEGELFGAQVVGMPAFSSISMACAFGMPNPAERVFGSVFLRCEKAARTTLKNCSSLPTSTADGRAHPGG